MSINNDAFSQAVYHSELQLEIETKASIALMEINRLKLDLAIAIAEIPIEGKNEREREASKTIAISKSRTCAGFRSDIAAREQTLEVMKAEAAHHYRMWRTYVETLKYIKG